MKKRVNGLNRFTFIFFMAMVFFTLFSESLHQLTMTKVMVTKVKTKTMKVQNVAEDGTIMHVTEKYKVIPKVVLDGNTLFVVEEMENEYRIARRKVVLGKEFEEWVEVTHGLESRDMIILGSDRTPQEEAIAIVMEDTK